MKEKIIKELEKKTQEIMERALTEVEMAEAGTWIEVINFIKEIPDFETDKIDFPKLLDKICRTFGREFRKISPDIQRKYAARIKDGFSEHDIYRAIFNCKNAEFHINNRFQYCTPRFFSQAQTLEKWGTKSNSKEPTSVLNARKTKEKMVELNQKIK